MQQVKGVKHVHIELTDKCQAQCPMCARNNHGGATKSFIRNGDITLEQFKEWFPKSFLAQLENFYSCGNYGDPAFARDCLEIYSYVRECNPTARLAIHTNGGMRNPDWWSSLAKAIGTSHSTEVIFAVDGFAGKHELYRRNTNFHKVIENMTAFINAGGRARVDSLVFEHNETDADDLERCLLNLGVKKVNFVSTTRFYGMVDFKVHNLNGDVEYSLRPAKTERFKKFPNNSVEALLDEKIRNTALELSTIKPLCEKDQSIYVDPYGNIFPCCWLGGEYIELPIKEELPVHVLRNISVQNTKDVLNDVGVPNCSSGILYRNDEIFWPKLKNYWEGKNKCLTCAKQCSTAIYNEVDKKA